MPVRNITDVSQAADAVEKDRWFNVAGQYIRPSQIVAFHENGQGNPEFVLVTGNTLTGTPTAIGDSSKILFLALRRVEFDGRSVPLPPLAPRNTTKFYLTSAMADGVGGDTVQSIITEAGPNVSPASSNITITENTEGRWIGREFTTDAAVEWPGTQYQSESVALLLCTQKVQDVNDSFFSPILNFGDGAYKGKSARRQIQFGAASFQAEPSVGGILRLAFFREAGQEQGKWYTFGYEGEKTGTTGFGSQSVTSALVQTDSGTWGNRDRYNFFRLERGISESSYDELLTAFKNETPGPSA